MVIAGNWPWWLIDSGRTGTRGPVREGRQRHLLAGGRRLDVDLVQRVEVALQLRQHLQDHVIAVELREILRDLALAEGVVQRVVDQLRLDAEARGRVAVDRQRQRGARRSAGRSRRRAAPAASAASSRIFGAHSFSSARLASCSVNWNCVRVGAAAEPHVLRRLQKSRAPSTFSSLGRSRAMICCARGVALVARLQRDEHAAVVAGAAAAADRHRDRGDVGIGHARSRRAPPDAASSRRRRCPARPPRSPVIRPMSCCGKKPFGMMTNR